MHNRKGFNRLGRKSSHRKALHRNMVTSLIKYERIETTQAKAKEIRRTAEKLVTRAKVDSVHNRRIVAKTVYEKDVINKLFTEVGPRFTERPGGYTRILKIGKRSGDAADMVILEFLSDAEKPVEKKKPAAKKKTVKKSAPVAKKTETAEKKNESSTADVQDNKVETEASVKEQTEDKAADSAVKNEETEEAAD